jgi:hypothetical protein
MDPLPFTLQMYGFDRHHDDILWGYRRCNIVYPKLEPDLPGHVHCAMMVSDRYGVTHILEDIG